MHLEDEITFRSKELPKRSFCFFEHMKRRNMFCDVKFLVGKHSVSAHRIVLASTIPFFFEALTNNVDSVDMPDVDHETILILIEFAYTCEVRISAENVNSLLSAACLMGVEEVQVACCDYLLNRLQPDNVLPCWIMANKLQCTYLLKNIDSFVKEHFEQISEQEQFVTMPYSFVSDLIDCDDLLVSKEECVVDVLMKWVKYSPKDRKHKLGDLLKKIRMSFIDPRYLIENVEKEELIANSVPCLTIISQAKTYHLFSETRDSIDCFSKKARAIPEAIDCHQGSGETRIYMLELVKKCTAQFLARNSDEWHIRTSRNIWLNADSAASVNKKIYYFHENTVLQYDPITNIYAYRKNTQNPKVFAAVSVLKDKIFICGGKPFNLHINDVESYNPENDQWENVPCMLACRSSLCVITLGKFIYALGGRDGSSVLDSVERYDCELGKWQWRPPMTSKRCQGASAVLNGKIYVCGGKTTFDESSCVATAEMYDPMTKKWETIEFMTLARHSFHLVSNSGKLMAIGGKDDKGVRLHTIDVYDPVQREWKLLGPTGAKLDYSAIVSVQVA